MNNFMKKIIVAIFSFVLFLTAQGVFAADIWNNAPNDCPDINIANYTQNTGFGNPCWTGTNITANAGDTINVRIYYHNTSNATATNTYIKLNEPTGTGAYQSFTAEIHSPQGNLYSSSVSVTIPSTQSLVFGSTRWYPNQTQTPATFLNGQNGSEVIGSQGLYIGNIAPGWATQGSVVVSFHVTNEQPPQVCSINSFTANPTTITPGNSSTLSWDTTNCAYVSITPGVGTNLPADGSEQVYPTQSTNYTLNAYNQNGILGGTRTKTVFVVAPQPMTGTISASPNPCKIFAGQSSCSSTVSWNTINPVGTSVVRKDGQTVATGNQGSQPFNVSYGQNTFTLVNNNQTLDSETVEGVCFTGTTWNGSTCQTTIIAQCTINSFNANPSTITQGNSSTLSWNTTNCTNVTLSAGGTHQVEVDGTETVSPNQTTTYTLTASGGGTNNTKTSYTTVRVTTPVDNQCRIDSLQANPSTINEGQSSTISWTTTNCNSVTLEGETVLVDGSKTVYPSSTRTYKLVAQGLVGSDTEEVTIYVNGGNNNLCEIVNFDASDTNIQDGDDTTLEWETNNCDHAYISHIGTVPLDGDETVSPSNDTTYVLTAYNPDGTYVTDSVTIYVDEEEDEDECEIDSFTASNTYITRGDSSTLRWKTSHCDDVRISSIGDVDDDGSEIVHPYSTTTYTLRAKGDNGSDTDTIRITVSGGGDYPPLPNANVITTVATNVNQTSAQVNGLMTGSISGYSTYYFEYGTSINLGMRTASRPVPIIVSGAPVTSAQLSETVFNLNPKTIYYFRAVGETPTGPVYGSIEVFQTPGNIVIGGGGGTIIKYVEGKTVIGSESPVMLRIENKYQYVGIGDIMDYVIFYKNISNQTLKSPMLQVYIPQGITVLNASRGTYSVEDMKLTVPLETLYPDQEGVVYIQARVDSLNINLAQIVTTAVLVWTTPNNAQENVMAYVLNNPRLNNNNLLGASAGSVGILGIGLVGWLFIILFILLLILLTTSYYRPINRTHSPHI